MDISKQSLVPFFVADRPASLRLLAGVTIPQGKGFGLMTHANTTAMFQQTFSDFPCVSPEACPVIGGKPCPFAQDLRKCSPGREMKRATTMICDSGVFTKEGRNPVEYDSLFETYTRMKVDFGIVIDVLKDKRATILSAREAIATYRRKPRAFRLIGVAQGRTVADYVECYTALKRMGYAHIAIGGMLKKKVKSARYVYVRNEGLLTDVLRAIRKSDPQGWLFALGCYSPRRHSIFTRFGVVGADYKGWIFQYEGRSPRKFFLPRQRSRFRQVRRFIEGRVLSQSQVFRDTHRLIVTSCSKSKSSGSGTRKAINLYDGPMFRMLRKHLHDFGNEDGTDILILSAKYGLIPPTARVRTYDRLLTYQGAEKLRPSVARVAKRWDSAKRYDSVLVSLAGPYLTALGDPGHLFPSATAIRVLEGRIGARLSESKAWLENP